MAEVTEKLYKATLDNGDVAIIRPLSPLAYQALLIEAQKLYPPPDKEPYVQPLPNAYEGAPPIAAEDNPAYQQALKVALQKQVDWSYVAMLRAGVVVDTEEGKDATLERYQPKLKRLALVAKGEVLATAQLDPWLATALYCMVTTRKDIQVIGDAARENLSREEIRAAIKTFRSKVQRNRPAGNSGKQVTPSAPGSSGQTAETDHRA